MKELTDLEKWDYFKAYLGIVIATRVLGELGIHAYRIIVNLLDRLMMGIATGSIHL